jgi:hypothetical protein
MSKRLSPVAVTQPFDFGAVAVPGGVEKLFSVREGIPVTSALDQLYCLLSTAKDTIETVAESSDGREATGWAASNVIEFAMALSASIQHGVLLHERRQREQCSDGGSA